MSRGLKTTIVILVALVTVGLITLPSLRQALQRVSGTQRTEEQARREVLQIPISTPTDANAKAQMYWLSPTSQMSLEASTIELPLSADPVERAKQLIVALIADAPASNQRTLPADAALLAFYIQPDGIAVADFSDALSAETPSGVQSEQLAVDSIVQTLGANVKSIRQIKILIHGQPAETLAGHLDLSGVFLVSLAPTAATSASQPPAASAPAAVGQSKTATPGPTTLAPKKKVPQ